MNLHDEQLNDIIEQSKIKQSVGDHSYNHECWACKKNFCSNESTDALLIIEYRDKLQQVQKWNTYLKNKKLIDELNDLDAQETHWQTILPNIKHYTLWLNDHNHFIQELSKFKQRIIDKQYTLKETYDFQIKSNTANHINVELCKIKEKIKYFSIEKMKLLCKIEHCDDVEKDLVIKITKADIYKNQENVYNKNTVLLEEMTNFISDKIQLFGHFLDTFKKYKSWVYNDKLLPSIINRTNHLLDHIFKSRQLELKFMFIDDSVVFTVIDEGNEISMEKLSGAQSFAVSLSFRLALSSTGICKFRCNQLFIDEGFCSFDQTNLVNVPELMTNLKNLFQEIVLVTHLQEIKSCADTIVNITRKDGISKISQF
jgi:DNA repair exonuclease SbcCD ATPase subunit